MQFQSYTVNPQPIWNKIVTLFRQISTILATFVTGLMTYMFSNVEGVMCPSAKTKQARGGNTMIKLTHKLVVVTILVGLVLIMAPTAALAAIGDLLGTVSLPGGGDCSVGGTFDGTYYITPMATIAGGCKSSTLGIYRPPAGGNGSATLVSTKSVVDGGSNPVNISAITWDSSRSRLWGAYANKVWLIDTGDPTVNSNALATFAFNPNVGGYALIDGLAWDRNDDTLYHSPDIDLNVYQFSLGTGGNPPLGTLMNTVAPQNAAGTADGLVSGVAIGSDNTLYIGRDGAGEIRRINKTTGVFISQFTTTYGRVEDLTCDPVTYAPKEVILAKDAYNNFYEAFEVEGLTCPLPPPPNGYTIGGGTVFPVDKMGLLVPLAWMSIVAGIIVVLGSSLLAWTRSRVTQK